MASPRSKAAIRARLAQHGITPRGLALSEAAAYCGIADKTFLDEVAAGRLPGPIPFGCERRIWDRHAVDAALDRMANLPGGGGANDEGAVDPYMAAIENS